MNLPPVLDLRDRAFRRGVDAACREWGVFYLDGHGIDPALCAEVLNASRRFFALPIDAKRKVERSKTNAWGFYDRELTKNRRDWKEIFDVGPAERQGPLAGARPQWPADDAFRQTLEAYYAACAELSLDLLHHLVGALAPDADALDADFREHTSFLRLNYYPPCDDPAPADADADTVPSRGELGISHHTDSGAITILLQDAVPALQVFNSGGWTTIEPRAGALIINVGDVVQVISNDAYPAPLHRVLVGNDTDRISVPFFFNPAYAMNYAPLVEPPHYRSINWGEFRAARADGDYADYGAEIQVSDFAIEPRGSSRVEAG